MVDHLIVFKLIAALTVFCTGISGGLLPLRVGGDNARFMSFGNVFSAGVFIAGGLVHLLNDSFEELEDSAMSKYFNVAPLWCGIGFLMILIVEEVALYWQMRAVSPAADDEVARTARAVSTVLAERMSLAVVPSEMNGFDYRSLSMGEEGQRRFTIDGQPSRAVAVLRQRLGAIPGSVDVRSADSDVLADLINRYPASEAASEDEEAARRKSFSEALEHMTSPQVRGGRKQPHDSPVPAANSGSPQQHDGHDHDHGHGHGDGEHDHDHLASALNAPTSNAVALLLLLALSFHSFIAGLGVGAQSDESVGPLIAILSHKGLAAFSLGTSLIRSGASTRRYRAYLLIFSSMTPTGIFVGILVSTLMEGDVPAVFTALAAGTFLYVALMEVLPKEMAVHTDKFIKISLVVLGYGLMSLLAIWA